MLIIGLLILAVLFFIGIFFIGESILFYAFAEKKDAQVAEKHYAGADRNGGFYSISAVLDDGGEKCVIKCIDRLYFRRDNNMDLSIGDKIVVWYWKKFGKCACDRGQPLKFGACILLFLAISAMAAYG